jgi:hypothetical protein
MPDKVVPPPGDVVIAGEALLSVAAPVVAGETDGAAAAASVGVGVVACATTVLAKDEAGADVATEVEGEDTFVADEAAGVLDPGTEVAAGLAAGVVTEGVLTSGEAMPAAAKFLATVLLTWD